MHRPPTTAAPPPAARRRAPGFPGASARNGGFTLVELLVVVAIIATLLGLSAGAAALLVTDAREAATRATLAKVDGKLRVRLAALRRSADRGTGDGSRVGRGVVTPLSVKTEQARRMPAYLVSFKPQEGPDMQFGTEDDVFPEPLFESQDVTLRVLNGGDADGPFAGGNYTVGSETFEPLFDSEADYVVDPTASSEALYRFLTTGESYGARDAADTAFTESELADADGDGLREIVDGFGNPLRFYRWPTRLVRPPSDGSGVVDLDGSGIIEPAEAEVQAPFGRSEVALYRGTEYAAAAAALLGGSAPPAEPTIPEDAADGTPFPNDPFLPTLGSLVRADPDDPQAQIGLNFAELYAGRGFVPGLPRNPTAADIAGLGPAFERVFHTPTTWYEPLVVSGGPDGDTGMYEPQDRDNFGHLGQLREPAAALDNLTNLQGGF